MPSLDFDAEKSAFRDYYNDNSQRFEQAKDAFLTLLNSLLANGGLAVAAGTGRIKEREESIKKFTRKYQAALEKTETPYEIKDHIVDFAELMESRGGVEDQVGCGPDVLRVGTSLYPNILDDRNKKGIGTKEEQYSVVHNRAHRRIAADGSSGPRITGLCVGGEFCLDDLRGGGSRGLRPPCEWGRRLT